MSPTTILEPTTDRPWRPRHLLQNNLAVLVAVSLLALTAMLAARAAPVHERSLTITNPTAYDLGVEVAGPDAGWLAITSVDRGATVTVPQVFDQGDAWRVRFSGQGRDGGTIVLTRDDLQGAGWHVTVPTSVADQLIDRGATDSPMN